MGMMCLRKCLAVTTFELKDGTKVKHTEYNRDGTKVKHTEYNRNGFKVKETEYNRDGSKVTATEYDRCGSKVKETEYDRDGFEFKETIYDRGGSKVKETEYDRDGSKVTEKWIVYDGSKVKETEYDIGGSKVKETEYDIEKKWWDGDGSKVKQTEYDRVSVEVEETGYDFTAALPEKPEYYRVSVEEKTEYYRGGSKLKETEYDRDGVKVKKTKYNRDGFEVKETKYDRGGSKVKETEYDRDGFEVKKTIYDRGGSKVKETECDRDGSKVTEKWVVYDGFVVKDTVYDRDGSKVTEQWRADGYEEPRNVIFKWKTRGRKGRNKIQLKLTLTNELFINGCVDGDLTERINKWLNIRDQYQCKRELKVERLDKMFDKKLLFHRATSIDPFIDSRYIDCSQHAFKVHHRKSISDKRTNIKIQQREASIDSFIDSYYVVSNTQDFKIQSLRLNTRNQIGIAEENHLGVGDWGYLEHKVKTASSVCTSTRLSALHANVQNATFENGAMNINSRGHLETANEAQADVEKGHSKQTQKLHIVTKFERDETYKTQEMKKRTPKRDLKSSSLGTIVGLGIYLVPYLVTLMLLCQPALTLAKPGGYNHGDTNTKTCRPTLSDSTHTEVDFRQLECEISACDKLSKIMFEKTGVESATTWNGVFVGVDKTHYQAIDTGYGYTLQNRSDYHAFPTKHLLYINPLKVEDEGKWRCVVYDDSYRVFTSDAMTLSQTDTQPNQTDGVDQKTYIKEQLYKDGFVVAMFGSTLFGMVLVVLLAGVLLILKQRDAKGMQNDKHYGGTPQTRISDKSQALLG